MVEDRLNASEQEFLNDFDLRDGKLCCIISVTNSFFMVAEDPINSSLSEASEAEEKEGPEDDKQDEGGEDDNACNISLLGLLTTYLPQMNVINVSASTNPIQKNDKTSSSKVLLSEFKNQKLALFAKRCARTATCTINMCPEDAFFCWPVLKEELDGLVDEGRAEDFLVSLKEIKGDPDLRDRLLRFVSCLYSVAVLV